MAIAPEIAKLVSEIIGVPRSTAETIVRRLGEDGLIPRGTRGRRPADLSSKDFARMLIALMSIADGIDGSAARVVQAVERISRLECGGSLKMALSDSIYDLDHPTLVVRRGSFLDQVTHLLERCADPDTASTLKSLVGSVGLTFVKASAFGWLELSEAEAEFPEGQIQYMPFIGDARRVIFGNADPTALRGMTREARLSIDALAELASIAISTTAQAKSAGNDTRQ